jgi:predicted MFS family arabinose efflux permease
MYSINFIESLVLIFFVSAPNTLFISMCLDISTNEKKVKYLSLLSFFSLLGSSLGYEIGGSLYNYLSFSISQIFIFQFGLCLATSILFSLLIKDAKSSCQTIENNKKFSFKHLFALNKQIYILLIALLTLTIGQILISKYLDTYIIHIGYEPATLGHYVLLTGLVGAISNLLIIPLVKKIKNKCLSFILILFVFLSSILTFITFSSGDKIIIFLLSTHLIYSIFKSIITPLEQNELSKYSSLDNNGKIMGARQTMLSIGNVVGPLIGSLLYTKGNPLVFIISGFIILLSFFIYLIYFLTLIRKLKERDFLKND